MLLRIMAGLVAPTAGQVEVGGKSLWHNGSVDSSVIKRLGVVFQDANLFPWYSIEENIALPLKLRGVKKRDRQARARELAGLVDPRSVRAGRGRARPPRRAPGAG